MKKFNTKSNSQTGLQKRIKSYRNLLKLNIKLVKNRNYQNSDKVIYESKRIIYVCFDIIEIQAKIHELEKLEKQFEK